MPLPLSFSRLTEPLGLLVLAAVAVGVLLLYFLKPPPQRLEVASLQVWEALARQRSRRKDLWRWLLSLLLSATIALSLAAVWTGAHSARTGLERPLFVIDVAPSMAVLRSDGRSRLEHAIQQARRLGSSAVPPMAITTTASDRLRVVHGIDGLIAALEAVLEQHQEPIETAGDTIAPAGRDALVVPRFPTPPRGLFEAGDLVLFTDGVSALEPPPRALVVSVFESARNVGLRALELRSDPANPASAYLEVHNDSAESVQAIVTLQRSRTQTALGASESTLARQTLTLQPGELWSGRVRLPSDELAGTVRARVDLEGDRYAGDDSASAVLAASLVRVFTDLDAESAVVRSLASNPRVELISRVDAVGAALDLQLADVAILGRTTPDRWPEVPLVVFAPAAVDWLPAASGELEALQPDRVQLLSEAAPIRELSVERTRTWKRDDLGAGMEPIVANGSVDRGGHAPETAPAVIGVRLQPHAKAPTAPTTEDRASRGTGDEGDTPAQGATVVALGFSFEQSNLARLPAFPVLLDDLVRVLAEPAGIADQIGSPGSEFGANLARDLDVNQQLLRATERQPEIGGGTHRTWLLGFAALALLLEPLLRRWGVTE